MARKRWPDAYLEVLHRMWGLYSVEAIANRLRHDFGVRYTTGSVLSMARLEGLNYFTAQGLLTFREAARQLEVSHTCVNSMVRRLGIVPIVPQGRRTRNVKFLDEAAMAALRDKLPVSPVPTVNSTEAGLLLGYDRDTIREMCVAGKLRHHYKGSLLRIERDQLPPGCDRFGNPLPGIPPHLVRPYVAPKIQPAEEVTADEAGLLLGIQGRAVRSRCLAGKLAYRIADTAKRRYLIPREALPSGRDTEGRPLPGIPEHLLAPLAPSPPPPPRLTTSRPAPVAIAEPELADVTCPHCGGESRRTGAAPQKMFSLNRVVVRLRCEACYHYHRRFIDDGTLYVKRAQKDVLAASGWSDGGTPIRKERTS